MSADLYSRLGLQSNASTDEIRRAYKDLAKVKHPDRGGNPEEFKAIQEAHEVLADDERRRMYDMTGSTSEQGHPMNGMAAGGIPFSFMGGMGPFGMPGVAFDMGDIFSGIFGGGMGMGGGGPRQRGGNRGGRGPNKYHDIGLRLDDFFTGKEIKLKFNQGRRCTACTGSGAEATEQCNTCNGSGMRVHARQIGPGMIAQTRGPCDVCNGEGQRILRACRACHGKRFIEKEKQLDIKITPGMHEGEQLTFSGECSDSLEYDIPGDVVLTLKRADSDSPFEWKNDDLMFRKTISFSESILGFRFVLDNHPNGKKPTLSWHGGPLLHGAVIRLDGGGMPRKQGGFGNLYVQVNITPPVCRPWSIQETNTLHSVLGGTVLSHDTPDVQTMVLHSSESKMEPVQF